MGLTCFLVLAGVLALAVVWRGGDGKPTRATDPAAVEEAVRDLQKAVGDGDDLAACKHLSGSLRGVSEQKLGKCTVKTLLPGSTSPEEFSTYKIIDASVVEPGVFAGVMFEGTDLEVGLLYSKRKWRIDTFGSDAATEKQIL